jgi:hypothetical protein
MSTHPCFARRSSLGPQATTVTERKSHDERPELVLISKNLQGRSHVKKLFKLLAVAAMVLAPLGFASPAHAATTAVDCAVNGSVTTDFHNYSFNSTTLACSGVFNGAAGVATYNVTANGATKGIVGADETCNEGQNSGNGVINATRASLIAGSAPSSLGGTVQFKRVGSVVVANGTLTDGTTTYTWAAVLQFTPTNPTVMTACAGGVPATMTALLTGDAVIEA